jgi:hypothetical protein
VLPLFCDLMFPTGNLKVERGCMSVPFLRTARS